MIFGLSEDEIYPIHGSFSVKTCSLINLCFLGYPILQTNPFAKNDIFTCLHQHIVGDFGSKQNGFVTLVDGVRGQLPGLRLVALAAQRLACAYQRRLRNGDHMVDMYMRMDQVSMSMIFTCEYIGR